MTSTIFATDEEKQITDNENYTFWYKDSDHPLHKYGYKFPYKEIDLEVYQSKDPNILDIATELLRNDYNHITWTFWPKKFHKDHTEIFTDEACDRFMVLDYDKCHNSFENEREQKILRERLVDSHTCINMETEYKGKKFFLEIHGEDHRSPWICNPKSDLHVDAFVLEFDVQRLKNMEEICTFNSFATEASKNSKLVYLGDLLEEHGGSFMNHGNLHLRNHALVASVNLAVENLIKHFTPNDITDITEEDLDYAFHYSVRLMIGRKHFPGILMLLQSPNMLSPFYYLKNETKTMVGLRGKNYYNEVLKKINL